MELQNNNDCPLLTKIKYKGQYIKGLAKETLLNNSENKYISKDTGMGFTTAMLNDVEGNRLIVSPNKGMIIDKAKGKYRSTKQLFICGGLGDMSTTDKWKHVYKYLTNTPTDKQNLIINTTPNQIVSLKANNPHIYNELVNVNIFIDEAHAYTSDATFRAEMGAFMELVYNQWRAKFTLSTATPNYQFFDIPENKNIQFYKVERETQIKKPLQISNNKKDAFDFIYSELAKDRLVVVFSNDINLHKKQFDNYKKGNLTGDTLRIKLQPYRKGGNYDTDSSILNDANIVFLSSSYFAGFDIKKDCSICIIGDAFSDHKRISINNVVQAYGRCRETVLNALFVNVAREDQRNQFKEGSIYYTIQDCKEQIKANQLKAKSLTKYDGSKELTPQLYVNRSFIYGNALTWIDIFHLTNDEAFKEALEAYNFLLTPYISNEINVPKSTSKPLKDRLIDLMELDSSKLIKDYQTMRENINTGKKNEGSYSYALAFDYLTCYILKECDKDEINVMLKHDRLRAERFYNSINSYLYINSSISKYQTNLLTENKLLQLDNFKEFYPLTIDEDLIKDWIYLYAIYKVRKNVFTGDVRRWINIYNLTGKTKMFEALKNDKHRFIKAYRLVDSELNLTESEGKKVNKILKNNFKDYSINGSDKFINPNPKKYIKKLMVDCIGYFFNHSNYEYNEIGNREFNPVTNLPSKFRSVIPFKIVECDISSSNPQIIDNLIGSDIGLNVYENVMFNEGVNRTDAKVIYNSIINKNYLSINDAKAFYLDVCGYDEKQALRLAQLTANTAKGSFYQISTKEEKKIIDNYIQYLNLWECYRFHDAVVIPLYECYNIKLPTKINDIQFHVSYLNSHETYNIQNLIEPNINTSNIKQFV